ncbi:NAD-dependent epimerase/dehydratase family protein [Marinibaculum pumilum]|uniref:NAD-dependent epimerase/dehydratase family protein n=1 Tax=Marinibaculum pumilum TaxID=1766165 RepID=A0ABV7L3Z5_9PROT
MTGTALILGDGGVVGRHLALRLNASPGWSAIGLSRRAEGPEGVVHIAADLLDRADLSRHAEGLQAVTHLFVAAKVAAADAVAEAERNVRLLANALDLLERHAPGLQRVVLVHGTKWYGCHLGPYAVPAREADPSGPGPLFYFDQHDLVRVRSQACPAARRWTWCSLRPHTVWGYSQGSGNNLVTLIAVYAALLKEAGLPLSFPGSEANFRKRSQATTADLLADALLWAAVAPACAGQDVNIVNGGWFRWCDLWPSVAALFDMPPAPPDPVPLVKRMKPLEAAWPALCDRHGLRERDLGQLVNWAYGDGLFGVTWDDVSAMDKARRLGFHATEDNGAALLRILDGLRRDRIVP